MLFFCFWSVAPGLDGGSYAIINQGCGKATPFISWKEAVVMAYPPTVYVPSDRLETLYSGSGSLPDAARGAVLTVRIEGGNSWASLLVQEGGLQGGNEGVQAQLDRLYGQVIDLIQRYGGSIISFSGESAIGWFPGDRGGLATSCALTLQRVFAAQEWRTPAGKPGALAISLAVTAGNVLRFCVGDPQIQFLEAIAGEVVEWGRLLAAEVGENEVAIGAEVLGGLGNRAEIKSWRQAGGQGKNYLVIQGITEMEPERPWPTFLEVRPDLLSPWAPAAGIAGVEVREVISCFMAFSGLDWDAEQRAGNKLDLFIRWMQVLLRHYGGEILRLTLGRQGGCLELSFSGTLHRAVSALLEVGNLPPAFNFIKDVRGGIGMGPVVAGCYGGQERRTYGISGRSVGLAQQLMDYAQPGQILLPGRFATLVGEYNLESLGDRFFKDEVRPVAVFAASGVPKWRAGPLFWAEPPSPLIGRRVEWEQLQAALLKLQQGEGCNLVIEGEAGIGKSCLIENVLESARRLGIPPLRVAGNFRVRTVVYFAWRALFQSLLGIEGLASREEQIHQLQVYAGGDRELLKRLPLLNVILPFELPENEFTGWMRGKLRAENTRDLLIHLLQRGWSGMRGRVLVLEDAHWLDSASWTLALAVIQQIQPLLVLVGVRPATEPLHPEYATLRAGAQLVTLGNLTESETVALICQCLEVRALAPELIHLILEKAGGHPFFSVELAYELRESRLLRVDESGVGRLVVEIESGSPETISDSLRSAISQHIERIPAAQLMTARAASVIGQVFAFRALRGIIPEEMEGRESSAGASDLKYIFKHNITQEVTYNLMLYTQRQELHQRVALWYESQGGDDPSVVYPLLAYHWMHAGDEVRAIEYLEKAGGQALRNYANEEAIEFFDQALDLVRRGTVRVSAERQGTWELQLGEACVNRSLYREGQLHLVRGIGLLGQPMPSGKARTILAVLGALGRQFLHRLWPDRFVGRSGVGRERLLALARAYEKLTEVCYANRESASALYSSFQLVNLAEGAGASSELARGYAMVASMLGFVPFHKAAQAYFGYATEVAQTAGDDLTRGWVAFAGSMYYSGLGNWGAALKLSREALAIFTRSGARHYWNWAMTVEVEVNYHQGEFGAGLQKASELYRETCQQRDISYQVFALTLEVWGHSCLGELESAENCADMVQALGEANPNLMTTTLVRRVLRERIRLALQTQDYPGLEEAVREMFPVVKTQALTDFTFLSTLNNLTEGCLVLWERNPQRAEWKELVGWSLQRLGVYTRVFPVGKPWGWFYRGGRHRIAGQTEQAKKCWRKAIQAADRLGMPYVKGRICYEWGRHLKFSDAERTMILTRAVEIFTYLGARFDLELTMREIDRGKQKNESHI